MSEVSNAASRLKLRPWRSRLDERPERGDASRQDHEGHQLARLRDVAFFARLFQAPR